MLTLKIQILQTPSEETYKRQFIHFYIHQQKRQHVPRAKNDHMRGTITLR